MNHVLIVEDEEFLAKTLEDNLVSEGFEIDLAMDGEKALEKIEKNKPNLILLDLLLPGKDGFYILGQIKQNPEWKLIPVIVLSNLGDDTDIKKALELGADDYFVKSQHPIQEVVDKVKKYLEGVR